MNSANKNNPNNLNPTANNNLNPTDQESTFDYAQYYQKLIQKSESNAVSEDSPIVGRSYLNYSKILTAQQRSQQKDLRELLEKEKEKDYSFQRVREEERAKVWSRFEVVGPSVVPFVGVMSLSCYLREKAIPTTSPFVSSICLLVFCFPFYYVSSNLFYFGSEGSLRYLFKPWDRPMSYLHEKREKDKQDAREKGIIPKEPKYLLEDTIFPTTFKPTFPEDLERERERQAKIAKQNPHQFEKYVDPNSYQYRAPKTQ